MRYIHRSGLLQALDNRTYAFPHRTFQEYLAATICCARLSMTHCSKSAQCQIWSGGRGLPAGSQRLAAHRIISDLVDVLVFQEPTSSTTLTPDKGQEIELVAEALLETGFGEFVRREAEPGRYGATFGRIQRWLLAGMRADQSLRPPQRASFRDASGAPRRSPFRSDAWYLPGEPLLGFVHVPAGPFLMGSDKKRDKLAYNNEYPQHSLALAEYYIARYPVTVAQFRAFVAKNDYDHDNSYFPDWLGNHPAVWVTWFDAIVQAVGLSANYVIGGMLEPLAHMLRDEGWQITCL
ncbi:MAG: SUMF1/EgtB/PvdO family nonheme iron enzyme [Caldilineales bacterium]